MPFEKITPMPLDEEKELEDALDPRRVDGMIVDHDPMPEPLSNIASPAVAREVRGINLDQLHRELELIEKRNLGGAKPRPAPSVRRPKPLDEEDDLPDISSGKERKCKILCSGDWLTDQLVTRIVSRWNMGSPMSSIVKDTNQQLQSTCRKTIEEVDLYSILLLALEDEQAGMVRRGRELVRKTRSNNEMNLDVFRKFIVEWRKGSPKALIAAKLIPYSNDSFVRKLFTQLNTRLRIERREEELNRSRRLKSPVLDERITQHARRTIIGDRVYVVIPMRNIPVELLPLMNSLPPIDLKTHDMPPSRPVNATAVLTAQPTESNEQRMQRLAEEMQRLDARPRTEEDIVIPEVEIGPPKDMSPDMVMSGEEIDFDNMSIDELFKEPTDGEGTN